MEPSTHECGVYLGIERFRFAVKLQLPVAPGRGSRTTCDVESEEGMQVVDWEACGGIN